MSLWTRDYKSAWWYYRGRAVIEVRFHSNATPSTITRVGRDQVDPAGRERAADWLREYLPRLTHDERYAMLWG